MRLAMLGINVGDRWDSVAEVCSEQINTRLRPFNDLHYVMALTMNGRRSEAEAIAAHLELAGAEVTVGR